MKFDGGRESLNMDEASQTKRSASLETDTKLSLLLRLFLLLEVAAMFVGVVGVVVDVSIAGSLAEADESSSASIMAPSSFRR